MTLAILTTGILYVDRVVLRSGLDVIGCLFTVVKTLAEPLLVVLAFELGVDAVVAFRFRSVLVLPGLALESFFLSVDFGGDVDVDGLGVVFLLARLTARWAVSPDVVVVGLSLLGFGFVMMESISSILL